MSDLVDARRGGGSFTRTPSGSHVTRRKSWQGAAPTIIVAERETPKSGSLSRHEREFFTDKSCSSLPLQLYCTILWVLLALSLLALLVLLATFVCIYPKYSYAEWSNVRDQAIVVIHRRDMQWALILLVAFTAAVLLIVCTYAACNCFVLRHAERKKSRVQPGLDDLSTSDLEQGDAHLKTGRRIAELMSDAEKQYVAEYNKKASLQSIHASEGSSLPAKMTQFTVQRLPEDEAIANDGVPSRSWSMRGILSFKRNKSVGTDMSTARSASAEALPRSPSWVATCTDVAAHLSSPDAFKRAASPYVAGPVMAEGEEVEGQQGFPKSAVEEEDPETPSTPTMGELMRRQREAYQLETGADGVAGSPLRTGSTRIVVRRPLETDDEGSAGSDTDEDDIYSRGQAKRSYDGPETIQSRKVRKALPADASTHNSGSMRPGSIGDTLSDTSNVWQDVGLESDGEHSPRGDAEGKTDPLASGHLLAAHTAKQHSKSTPDTLTIKLSPLDALGDEHGPVQLMVCLTLEEVLPRPQTGLLHRMLRLAGVKRLELPGIEEPVFVLHPGTEYMVGVRVLQSAEGGRALPLGVRWLRLKPTDGQEARFPVEQEKGPHIGWFGTAAWDTSVHDSPSLSGAEPMAEAKALPVDLSIGLESTGNALTRVEGHFQLCVYLDTRTTASRLTTNLPGNEYVESARVKQYIQEMGLPANSSSVASLVLCVP